MIIFDLPNVDFYDTTVPEIDYYVLAINRLTIGEIIKKIVLAFNEAGMWVIDLKNQDAP